MSADAIGRRDFLRLAAAGAVVSTASLAAAATPRRRTSRIRVGYQIFGWGRYFPSAWWKGATTVGALGYRGIEGEYTIAELYAGREEEFEEGMRRANVALAALYSTTDLERPAERVENIRKNMHAAAFCRRMGSRMIVVGGTEARAKDAELYKRYAAEANELGKRVYETHGVRVGVHPHVGSLVETREEIARVMDGTDPRFFFLAPDTGHLIAGGSDPVEVFRSYRDRIVHAHLKDWAPPATPGARGAFQPLGKGKVDFPALLQVLQGGSFDGWLDVELDGGRDIDPAQVARGARDYITSTLKLSLEDAGTQTAGGA
jgi:inosose dehydratase